jgi:hypothetical protein
LILYFRLGWNRALPHHPTGAASAPKKRSVSVQIAHFSRSNADDPGHEVQVWCSLKLSNIVGIYV